MPLYEYRCENCGEQFEVMQKFSDQPLTVHEKCGGGKVHRLLSAPALQFKGSGWYITDYAKSSSNKPEANASSKNGGAKGDSSEGNKSTKSDSSGSSTPASSGSSSTSSSSSSDKK